VNPFQWYLIIKEILGLIAAAKKAFSKDEQEKGSPES